MSEGLCQEWGVWKRWHWEERGERTDVKGKGKKRRKKLVVPGAAELVPLVVSVRAWAAFLSARDVQRTNSFVSTIKPSALCWPCPV